jgi:Arc/MetJ family transcription regulator
MQVYDADMARTNIVIDDALVERAMRLYNLKTKREAVDLALRRLVGEYRQIDILDLQGMGWEGDLDELRADRMKDLWSS